MMVDNMDNQKIKRINSFFFRLIGREFRLEEFDDRLLLQKIVYMLQKAGINFGYYFSWYLRGPYSAGLAKDAYEFYGKESTHKPQYLSLIHI